jgi:hypothetical protein
MEILSSTESQRLDDDGYLVLEGLVQPEQLRTMRTRLQQLLAVTAQEHAGTLIVGGLLGMEEFDAAWMHRRVLAATRQVLGEDFRLLGVSSRGLRPGHGQQALHTDWGGQGTPGVWYGCHAICALVDFTLDNGATRIVPGSHRNLWLMKGCSDPRRRHPAQQQLIGPAGTIFILNIHCFHSAFHNASSEPRLALFSNFSRRDSPLLSFNPIPNPDEQILARYSAEIRALLVD